MGLFGASVSGMDAFQTMMNVIGNNVANVNTTGYKTSQVNFADILSQTLANGSSGSTAGIGGTNPQQVGLGVKIAEITPNFSQGSLTQTGNSNDLAIDGNGLFAVSPDANPTSPNQIFYTRAGNFHVDNNGNLVTADGDYVLGTSSAPTPGGSTSMPTWTAINTEVSGQPAQFTIGPDGTVTVSGGSTSYYIPIVGFPNYSGLQKMGSNLYTAPASNSAGTPSYGQAGTGNFGAIQAGYLESSNVDLSQELTNMMIANTGYGANSKVISTQNQMLQTLLQNV
ncbi:flagellar hook-basal body complex protein [Alicyclobacillaceae bacterium I2511]|nr:flagellar hook-basal body complex protein [Alicyclobacillaceae bacterium I2511]